MTWSSQSQPPPTCWSQLALSLDKIMATPATLPSPGEPGLRAAVLFVGVGMGGVGKFGSVWELYIPRSGVVRSAVGSLVILSVILSRVC